MFTNTSFDPERSGFGESLPQQIYKHILKKIIEWELKAGDKIVEEDIARELGTSRAPVREALYLLQVDGVVERIPRRGTIVAAFTEHEIVEYNDVMIGLIRTAVDFSRDQWMEAELQQLRDYRQEVQAECDNQQVIAYQLKVEQLLKFIFAVAGNKALIRYYEKTSLILKVFAGVRWDVQTMENFQAKLDVFADALLKADYGLACEAIYETLKRGVK